MSEKLKQLQKSRVKFFGFEFDAKSFWITMSSAIAVLVLLVALTVFGVEISWYGVLFGIGFLVALVLAPQL